MNPSYQGTASKSIFLLIAVNILVGGLLFRNYGYAWDEPLFYEYGDALGYAYSPAEWRSGSFDLERSYGSSGDDHKTRGPAYLLLARGPVYLLEALGLDSASAWHLANFLFFQIGVYFLYRLAARWMKSSAALAAAALFAWQPLLWGHAFINPKDPPFLVFFLASVCLGFEMIDQVAGEQDQRRRLRVTVLPALLLGMTTSIRVLGPLAGLLVLGYALAKFGRQFLRALPSLFAYGAMALLTMFATWPFLWEDPLANFIDVFRLMSDNPTTLSVLFGGEVYRAGELPRRYMPFMLATTLTEPVWLLFFSGLLSAYIPLLYQRRSLGGDVEAASATESWQSLRSSLDRATIDHQLVSLSLILLWFVTPLAYVLLRRPAMYDGLRHFLFILPPIFVFTGFAFQFLIDRLVPNWLRAGLILILLSPGVSGIVRLHPYEYTYYNSFVGGTDGAFRQYETDYWLTCYKEAVQALNSTLDTPADLYVHREAYIAAYYARDTISVHELRGALDEVQSGDYVLVNTRTNEDRRVLRDAEPFLHVGRSQAAFCIIKQIP